MEKSGREVLGVAAVPLVEAHDVHAACERFRGNPAHVVRVARPVQAVQYEDGRARPWLGLPMAFGEHARVVIDVEVAADGRRETGEIPGGTPAEERHSMA